LSGVGGGEADSVLSFLAAFFFLGRRSNHQAKAKTALKPIRPPAINQEKSAGRLATSSSVGVGLASGASVGSSVGSGEGETIGLGDGVGVGALVGVGVAVGSGAK